MLSVLTSKSGIMIRYVYWILIPKNMDAIRKQNRLSKYIGIGIFPQNHSYTF